MFCSCIVVPQLYERVIGPGGTCKKGFILLMVLYLLSVIFESAGAGSHSIALESVGGTFSSLYALVLLIGLCLVRQKVRFNEGIPQETCDCCESCEDCCCAYWCNPCTSSQLLRHFGLTAGKYSLTSATGDLETAESKPLAPP